jgi:hypothetical protein
MLQTEYEFTLPCGYVDEQGDLHRSGTMRLATVRDELAATQEPLARTNDTYASVVILSRVITRLGTILTITPSLIERIYSADFAHLQELFVRLNDGSTVMETRCPACGTRFELDTGHLGHAGGGP